jgi:hypothetical protein
MRNLSLSSSVGPAWFHAVCVTENMQLPELANSMLVTPPRREKSGWLSRQEDDRARLGMNGVASVALVDVSGRRSISPDTPSYRTYWP